MKQESEVSAAAIDDALQRILKSEELSGAKRLKSLLEYVCSEYIAGRGDQILGKTIGIDVYGREPSAEGDVESIVRVDASRLRRRLSDYYAGSGSDDPLVVSIPKGGYVPKFEHRPGSPRPELKWLTAKTANIGSSHVALVLLVVLFASTSVYLAFFPRAEKQTPSLVTELPNSEELVRLVELSPIAAQARDLAKDGRRLVFPATEPGRVKMAHAVFEETMKIDPNYYGGYAGASHTTAILAGIAETQEDAARQLAQSREFAEKAFVLQPDAAWSLSAMAMNSFLYRNFDEALDMSARAVELSGDDPYIRGFDMIIAFFSGDFERALESSSARIHEGGQQVDFNWRTAQANAWFHLGEYDRAVKLYEEGISQGEPPAEVNLAHVIASKQAAGDTEGARMLAQAFSRTWPESRLAVVLPLLFKNKEHAQAVLSLMLEAGWVNPLSVESSD